MTQVRGSESSGNGQDPLIGQTFSHYRIVARLGGGGMGVVYQAEDARLRRAVALKFVSEDLSREPDALRRFVREAQAASALNHANICTIYDVGEQGGRSFIVMELLDGTTLKDRLAGGPLPLRTVLDVGIQIADALDAAHGAGIVHRDIKPANVFIGARERVKVLDFGLAKIRDPDAQSAELSAIAGTELGAVMGTAAYMAPEQARGERIDHRADIWSLGAVLHEMATGARPAPGVRSHVEGVPELERIITKCLAPDRELRYQYAAELRTDLEKLRDAPAAATAPARRRALGLSLGAAVLVGGAAVAGMMYGGRPAPLTDKDTIVLAEFTNTTGDPVFDDTLRQGLAAQLQQSPFLSLVSDDRIRRTLTMMEQPADARLTAELAREACVRTQSAAVLDGSISSLGSEYVLAVRATNCATGDILSDEQVQVARKEDVLAALSELATNVRGWLGESRVTIERYSRPLQETTTESLDAWKAFTTARQVYFSSGRSRAEPLFERAIALDPDFAIAHAQLGIFYSNQGESALSRQSTTKAYELRHRATDTERFFIETVYDRQVTGNMDRELDTLEAWAETYPRDPIPHGLLAGFATRSIGRYEQGIAAAERQFARDAEGGLRTFTRQ